MYYVLYWLLYQSAVVVGETFSLLTFEGKQARLGLFNGGSGKWWVIHIDMSGNDLSPEIVLA